MYKRESVLKRLNAKLMAAIDFSPQKDDYLLDWHGKDDGVETKRLVNTLPFTVRTSFCFNVSCFDISVVTRLTNIPGAVCAAYRVASASTQSFVL